jgi:hypothetical protein
MISYKQYIRIIKLNWLHLVGFYCCVEIATIIHAGMSVMQNHDWKTFFLSVSILALFTIFTYGLIILIPFYVAIVVLDIVLLSTVKRTLLPIFILEWVLISPIFIYWAVQYSYWLWIALIMSFLVTQIIKSNKLKGEGVLCFSLLNFSQQNLRCLNCIIN